MFLYRFKWQSNIQLNSILERVGQFKGGGGGVDGGKKGHPRKNFSNISYNDETWNSYTLAKEDPKNI